MRVFASCTNFRKPGECCMANPPKKSKRLRVAEAEGNTKEQEEQGKRRHTTENAADAEDTERNRGRSWFGRGRRFFFGERANVINHVPFHFGFCAVLVARHLALTLGQDVKELAVSQVFERRRIAPVAQLEL